MLDGRERADQWMSKLSRSWDRAGLMPILDCADERDELDDLGDLAEIGFDPLQCRRQGLPSR